jgi:HlyD family secretion protein
MKKIIVLLVVVAAALGAWYWFRGRGESGAGGAVRFRTAKVERGEIVEGVQASGAVQPVLLVQVGTQVSGVIDKIFVDFNSKVKAGQTIALLDSRRLEAQVAQDEAAVSRARADVERLNAVVLQSRADLDRSIASLAQSKSDIDRVKALLTQAVNDLERQRTLADKRLVSPADVDAAVAAKGSLDAQLASAIATVSQNEAQVSSARALITTNEAQIKVGESAVLGAEAQLKGDRVNLEYATIESPVDGVIVSRNVDVGQTVASSLSAPTLFLIANDLTKIQVQASVPEADLGKIKHGQHAVFSVDAHPEKSFEGVVSQIRIASTTVSNVVTYTVLVDASNPDGLLLPGMTANVTFEVARSAKDALSVASSALRLQPSAVADLLDEAGAPDLTDTAKPEAKEPRERAADDKVPTDGAGAGPPKKGQGRRTRGIVYVQAPGNRLHAVAVKVGISDGIRTIVEPLDAAALPEGAEIVTAVMRDSGPATTNPFAPTGMGAPPRGSGIR